MPRRYSDYDLALIRRKMGENIPVPPKPKRRDNEESREQGALIRWWAVKCRAYALPERALFSIPNGGWRSKAGGAILKREGQRNGVSDLFLMTARGGWHGLFIEMKATKGVVSDAQEEFLAEARAQNYCHAVCWSCSDAVFAIERYVNL